MIIPNKIPNFIHILLRGNKMSGLVTVTTKNDIPIMREELENIELSEKIIKNEV